MSTNTEPKQLLTGWWWRPEYPDDQIPGTAYLLKSGQIKVDLIDTFSQNMQREQDLRPTTCQFDQIRGTATDGEPIILFQVDYTELTHAKISKGDRSSVMRAPRFLEGARRIEDPSVVREILIEIEGLLEWLEEFKVIDTNWDNDGVSMRTSPKTCYPDLQVELDNCTIGFISVAEGKGNYGRSINFHAHSYCTVMSKNGLSYDETISLIRLVSNFLCLARGTETRIIRIKIGDVKFVEEDRATWDRLGGFHDWSLPFIDPESVQKRSGQNNLFQLKDIRSDFPTMLKNWIENYEKLPLIYDLYFSVERASFMYVESIFLSYVRAVEGYFRSKHPDSRYISQEKFDTWVDEELAPILHNRFADDDGKKLPPHIIHTLKTMGNRWPLDQILRKVESWRSKKLTERLLSTVATAQKDWKKTSGNHDFIYRIANTRNILSHGLPANSDFICPEDQEFHQAYKYLKTLLQASLLEITGLDNKKIDSLLLKKYTSGL